MINVVIDFRSIDETRLQAVFDAATGRWSRLLHGKGYAASEVARFGIAGRLQISDGERDLFETEGEGPGETDLNILGILFDAFHAVGALTSISGPLETAFGPDWYQLIFERLPDGKLLARTSPDHRIVADPQEWHAALDDALQQIRMWIADRAPYLNRDRTLAQWLNGGQPPERAGPFGTP